MPKPKKKAAGRGPRRPAKAKAGAKERKAKAKKPKAKRLKAKIAKRPPRKGKAVAPKKKKTVRAARKPAAPKAVAPKPAVPAPAPIGRKEETRMAGQNCPIHNSPDCFKPALDAYIQQAYDGYCTKIDWPYWRIIPKGWKPK